MELRQMRSFPMVAEERHFGRAARRLNIVQPALSMQIKKLEGELGAELFDRSGGRIELTEAGRLLQPEAALTVAQAARTRDTVARLLRGNVGLLRIGFSDDAVFGGILQASVARFRRTHSSIEIVLEEMSGNTQRAALRANELDIGYSTFFAELEDEFAIHKIGASPWLVAVSAAHPLAGSAALTADQIAAQTLFVYRNGKSESGQWRALTALLGTEPETIVAVPNSVTLLASVAIGSGVALVPATLANIGIAGLVFLPITPPITPAELHVIARKRDTSPLVAAFIDAATAAINDRDDPINTI